MAEPKGIGKFLETIAPAVPIVGGIASNIIAGINERKARLYNSPANQVKRMQEAGLPLAAGSNITAGGGISTKVSDLGTSNYSGNLQASITRQIDRKKLQIHDEELRLAKVAADIAEHNRQNQLNPSGVFENTNMGSNMMNTMGSVAAATKHADLINTWLPIEKSQSILKNNAEIAKITADTRNSLAQHKIIVAEGQIKKIMSQWQSRMSQAEFTNIIRRNTGLKNQNEISSIQGEILRNTKIAQIHMAQMHAITAGQTVAANQMGLLLKGLETDSAKAYYQVRARADNSYKGNIWDRFTPADLIYLQMFTPKESSMNLGTMSNIFK